MTVQTLLDWLDSFAPFANAEGFDNVGLLVGDAAAEVRGVLFCLDATPGAVTAAREAGCNVVFSHHPLLFGGATRIYYARPEGQALRGLMADGAHLIAAHTNLDKAPGGISESLAQALGLCDVQPTESPYVRVGALPEPLSLADFAANVQQALRIVPRLYGGMDEPIRRVAVGPGAFGMGCDAAIQSGAQVYVTGEIHLHQLLDANGRGLVVLDAGHAATEQPGVRALYQRFLAELAPRAPQARAVLYPYQPGVGANPA